MQLPTRFHLCVPKTLDKSCTCASPLQSTSFSLRCVSKTTTTKNMKHKEVWVHSWSFLVSLQKKRLHSSSPPALMFRQILDSQEEDNKKEKIAGSPHQPKVCKPLLLVCLPFPLCSGEEGTRFLFLLSLFFLHKNHI